MRNANKSPKIFNDRGPDPIGGASGLFTQTPERKYITVKCP